MKEVLKLEHENMKIKYFYKIYKVFILFLACHFIQVKFDGLEGFENSIISFFKERITEYLETDQPKHDSNSNLATNRDTKIVTPQDIFIQKRGERLLGRDEELQILTNFTEAEAQDDDLDEAMRVFVVLAHTGMGKSSLLARFVQNLKKVAMVV